MWLQRIYSLTFITQMPFLPWMVNMWRKSKEKKKTTPILWIAFQHQDAFTKHFLMYLNGYNRTIHSTFSVQFVTCNEWLFGAFFRFLYKWGVNNFRIYVNRNTSDFKMLNQFDTIKYRWCIKECKRERGGWVNILPFWQA